MYCIHSFSLSNNTNNCYIGSRGKSLSQTQTKTIYLAGGKQTTETKLVVNMSLEHEHFPARAVVVGWPHVSRFQWVRQAFGLASACEFVDLGNVVTSPGTGIGCETRARKPWKPGGHRLPRDLESPEAA